MSRINTNIASLRGLRNLNKANQLLDTSLTRLSTGLKINSGKDNPAGLIASESLRLQVTSIEQSIKNSNRANNVISTADGALGEINGLLSQVRGLVQEGLNDGALSQSEIEANQLQIDAALSAINRISSNTTFAGDKLIDGSKAFNTTISTADSAKLDDFRINEALLGSSGAVTLNTEVTSLAERAQLRYGGGDLTSAATIEISGSDGQEVLFLGGSSSIENIRDAVNNVSDTTGVTSRILAGAAATAPAVASTFTTANADANADVLFERATGGTDATLGGSVSIEYIDDDGNTTPLSVNTIDDGNGNFTVQVTLATDAAGVVTSTANDVAALITGDATASALVSATAQGTGLGVIDDADLAPAALTGGQDSGTINFSDIRPSNVAGTIDVVFADPGANSQALGVVVTENGDDRTITINLATDGTGALTSTVDDIIAAIAASEDASALVSTSSSGDTTAVAAAVASTDLIEANGTDLVFESSDFGARETVEVNVLDGTFATTAADGVTESRQDSGVDIGVTINGQTAEGKGLQATVRNSTLDASFSFNEDNNLVGTTASLTINGGGSLFQIGQEVSAAGQIGIGIDAVNTARLGGISGKLYELGTGNGKSLLDVRDGSAGGAELVNIIEESLDRVSTLRGRLGAIQKNVIETNISTLGVALENISEARSQILDTDFAAETAALTKAQILNQSGISVLSIANQNPQSVLSLLG